MNNPIVHLSVGKPYSLASIKFAALMEVLNNIHERCLHDETCEYIREASKIAHDAPITKSEYSFGVLHVPHLYNALLSYSIIVFAQHQSYIPDYSEEDALKIETLGKLLTVVGKAAHQKESFAFYVR